MRHRNRKMVYLLWVAVRDSFQNWSWIVAVDLQRKLQAEQFAKKGDLQAHFNNLCRMCEELAVLGKTLNEDNFYAIIIISLPPSFNSLISSINGTSSVTGQTLLPDDLITSILEDYDWKNANQPKAERRRRTWVGLSSPKRTHVSSRRREAYTIGLSAIGHLTRTGYS